MGPNPGQISVEVIIVDSNGLTLYSKSTDHIARQSGWNLALKSLTVGEKYIDIGIDREGYS